MKRKNYVLISIMLALNIFVLSVSASENTTGTIKTPQIELLHKNSKGKITLEWEKAPMADGYEIQYAQNPDFSKFGNINIDGKNSNKTTIDASGMSKTKDLYFRMRACKVSGDHKSYSEWSQLVRTVEWNKLWKYAKNSKIHTDAAVVYYSPAKKRKGIIVAVNAGHGTKGGSRKKTRCHPNGSKKVTGGSTGKGARYAPAVTEGTTVGKQSEAKLNLKVAKKLKYRLQKSGYDVLMIRESEDVQLDNVARTVMANNVADCHVSIHYDSTNSNKGAFYIGVPGNKSYRKMKPVKQNYKKHEKLGKSLIKGLKSSKVKICKNQRMSIDLTQTSYSTIPSVDMEVGDRKSSTKEKQLNKIADGLLRGVDRYFTK